MANPRMYWWQGRDLAAFFAEVNRRGSDNVRIEFHVGDGLLYVKDESESGVVASSHEGGEGFNFVKVCPPVCPNGD